MRYANSEHHANLLMTEKSNYIIRMKSMFVKAPIFLVVAVPFTGVVHGYNCLIIGGTRFSGASLWKELHSRGHDVTLYNRGKTAAQPVAGHESDAEFESRVKSAKYLKGDRKDPVALKSLIDPGKYDYVFDMNAREESDTRPLAELFVGSNLQQYVFMSSAGVYLQSEEMPHLETDPTDPKSRHKGKLDSEECLAKLGLPWCSFRPTYICGPGNYNPLEQYFFERIDAGRTICIPGNGKHLTGFGHVEDLAVAMANVIGRTQTTTGKCYNIQNSQAITFDGVVETAAMVMRKDVVGTLHYQPKDVRLPEGKKGFPMRPQHFFTGIHRAMIDLEWTPKYDTVEAILRDSYKNDFLHVKEKGGLKGNFEADDFIIEKIRGAVEAFLKT